MGSRHVTDDPDRRGPDLLRGGAVVGVVLIQAGLLGLFVSTWWQHARNAVANPALDTVIWHAVTGVLVVWTLVAQVRGLVRGRRTPLLVVCLATGVMVVAVLLEALGPR